MESWFEILLQHCGVFLEGVLDIGYDVSSIWRSIIVTGRNLIAALNFRSLSTARPAYVPYSTQPSSAVASRQEINLRTPSPTCHHRADKKYWRDKIAPVFTDLCGIYWNFLWHALEYGDTKKDALQILKYYIMLTIFHINVNTFISDECNCTSTRNFIYSYRHINSYADISNFSDRS